MNNLIFTTDKYPLNQSELTNFDSEKLFVDKEQPLDLWMDSLIKTVLSQKKYINIFLPLSFGNHLIEFLGLEFAINIRCTKTINQCANIFVYGTERMDSLKSNEYFTILLTKGVSLIDYNKLSILKASSKVQNELPEGNLCSEMNTLNLSMPNFLYDNHSVSNVWGMFRLLELEGVNPDEISSINREKRNINSIYFKWLITKNNVKDLITPHILEVRKEYSVKLPGPTIIGKIDLDALSTNSKKK